MKNIKISLFLSLSLSLSLSLFFSQYETIYTILTF